MGLTNPYRQKHYQGEYATETGTGSVLAWIRANKWDSTGDGTGDPQEGMIFYDTAVDRLKVYANAAWRKLLTDADPAVAAGSDGQLQYNNGGTALGGAAGLYWDDTQSFLGVGTTAPEGDVHVAADTFVDVVLQSADNTHAAWSSILDFRRSRGSLASKAAIQTGDSIGVIDFLGYDGSVGFESAAYIEAVAEGTIGTGVVPGRLSFYTANASGVVVERIQITSAGIIKVGKASGATGHIDFVGTTSGAVSLKVADVAGTWAMTLPTAPPDETGYVLSATTGGVCSWAVLPSAYLTKPFTAQTSVVFDHNLGAFPIVQVLDADDEVLIPQGVVNTSVDSLTVTFSEATTGTILVTMGSVSQTRSKSFMISSPTADAHSPLWRVPVDITITHIHVLCMGGTNIVGQLWEYDSNGANGTTVDSDITAPAGTNTNDDGAISNPGITAGNYLGWKTTSVSGTPTRVIVTFEYTES